MADALDEVPFAMEPCVAPRTGPVDDQLTLIIPPGAEVRVVTNEHFTPGEYLFGSWSTGWSKVTTDSEKVSDLPGRDLAPGHPQ